MSVTPPLRYARVNATIAPRFPPLPSPRLIIFTESGDRGRVYENVQTTSFQQRFRVQMFFCLNIGLKATELSKPMKTIRNSPQLTLLVGHDMALIPYLSSENIKFDGGRRLAAAAKRRRPSDHCLIVPLYPRLVSILSLLGSGDTGDWSMGRLARRISSIISRHP
jgi:hypothetical protein